MTEYSFAVYSQSPGETWRWLAGGFSTEEEARQTIEEVKRSNDPSVANWYKITRITSYEEVWSIVN